MFVADKKKNKSHLIDNIVLFMMQDLWEDFHVQEYG